LRHQARQHAEPKIEQESKDQKRRRELDADAKGGGDDACHVLRRVAHQRQLTRRKDCVAVVHRHDDQVVQVRGENHGDAKHGQEISDQRTLFVLGRINGGDEAQAQLLRDDRSGHLQRGNRQSRGEAQYRTDDQFLEKQNQHRPECFEIDRIGLLVRRQKDCGQHQRYGETYARWHAQFADTRQQHDHGAHAGKCQQECGRQRRQE
jgi:hypothetical protein